MKCITTICLILLSTLFGQAGALKVSQQDSLMQTIDSKTVVFITRAFVSNSGWDEWKAYFESKGYKTIAPAWPHKVGSAEELRKRHPDKDLAALQLETVVDYHWRRK